MHGSRIGLVALLLLTMVACQERPDAEALRAEILELHRSFIKAHLDKDAAYIARFTAPDYVSVSDGRVERMNARQMEARLSDYLGATRFREYRDLAEPVIGVSRDGSLAWAIVQVRTAATQTLPDSSTHSYDVAWAWMTLYRREDGTWSRIADVSTKRPYEETE